MYQFKRAQNGLTLVELLLVISLLSILSVMSFPFASNFLVRNQHEVTVDRVIGSIRKAQAYSMGGRNDGSWGICLQGSVVRLYRGSCITPDQSEDYQIPSSVSITGFSDVAFLSARGEPDVAATITVSSRVDDDSITINSAGGVSVN